MPKSGRVLMELASRPPFLPRPRAVLRATGLGLASLALMACSAGPPELPDPRPVVIRSGERLRPEKERLQEIDQWFRPQLDNIREDPSFLIETVNRDTPAYPWESLVLEGDTARIGVEERKSPDAATAYSVYAHYHLMEKMGRLEEFLPGASGLQGFSLERAILSRLSDAWLLGRSVYNVVAYDVLEELMYSKENDYLDAFILTARGEEFSEEKEAWIQEDPQAQERYRSWFMETFSREPPGMRGEGKGE